MLPVVIVIYPCFHDARKLSGSNALEPAIDHLQHLRMVIREGTAGPHMFCSIVAALRYFNPLWVVAIRELCFSWINNILNSSCAAGERYQMAGKAVELAWKHISITIARPFYETQPARIPSLLDFLWLSEKYCSVEFPSAPGALTLRILSTSSGYGEFGPTTPPTPTSTLSPTLCSLAAPLKVFRQSISGWFSSQAESVSN